MPLQHGAASPALYWDGCLRRLPSSSLRNRWLVARILAELQANPAAQQLLLRAMLTNEFLGMPARLDAIERDVAEIKSRVTTLEHDGGEIRIDNAGLGQVRVSTTAPG